MLFFELDNQVRNQIVHAIVTYLQLDNRVTKAVQLKCEVFILKLLTFFEHDNRVKNLMIAHFKNYVICTSITILVKIKKKKFTQMLLYFIWIIEKY